MRKSRLKILPARSLLTLGFLLLYLSCPTIGEMFRIQPDYGFKSFDQPELKCYTRLTETEDSLLLSPSVDFQRLNRTNKDKDTDIFGRLKYGFMNKTYSNAGEGPTTTVVFLDRFKQFEPFVARDKNSVESSAKEQGKLNLSRHLKSREFSLTRKRSLYRAQIQEYRTSSEKFNRLVVRKQQSLWMRNAKYGSREIDANGKSAKQAYLRRYENRQKSETRQGKSTVNSESTGEKQYRRLVRDRESSSRSIKILNDRRKFKADTLQSRDSTHRRVVRSLSQHRDNKKLLLLRSDNLSFRRSLHNSVDSRESQTKRSVNQQNRSTFRRVSVSDTPNLEKFNERQIKTNYASYERERSSRSIRQTSYRKQIELRDGTERFSRRTTNKVTRTRVVSNISERPEYFPTDNLTHRRSLFRRDSVNSRVSQKSSVEGNLYRDISSRKVNNEPVKSRRESRERLNHESAERSKRMSERQHIVKPSIMRAASEPVTSRDRRNVLIKQRYFKSDKSVSLRVSSEQNDRRISRERISKHRYTVERYTASETRELIASSRKQAIKSRGISTISVSPRILSQHSEGKRISNERKNEYFDNRGTSRNGRKSRERSELIISVPALRTSRRISIESVSSERLLKTSRDRSAERRYLTGSRILKARDVVSTRQLNNEPVSSVRHDPERMNSRAGGSPPLTNSRHVFIEKLSGRKKYDDRYRIKPINKRITSRMIQNNPKHGSLERLVSVRPDVLRVSNGFKENSVRRHLLLSRERRQIQMRRSVLETATSRRFYLRNSYTLYNYNDAENTRTTEQRFVRTFVNRIVSGEEHRELNRHVSLERSLSHRVRSSDFSDRREAVHSQAAERRMSRTARERITSHVLTMKSRSFERASGRNKFPRHITTGRFTTVMQSERKNLLTRRLPGSNINRREQNIKGEFKNSSCSAASALRIQHTGHTTFRIESTAAKNYFTKHSQRGILRNVENNMTSNKYVLSKEANRYVHNSFETNVNCNLSKNSKFNSVTSSVCQVKLCSNLQNTHSLFTSVPSSTNKDAYIHNISKLQQKQNGNWIHIILEPAKQMMFLLAMLLSVKHDKMWSLQSFSNALLMDPDTKYSTTDLKELNEKVRDYKFDSKKILENGPSRFWITNLL